MVCFTYLQKHLWTIPPSILLTDFDASAWDRPIRGHLRQTTICQMRRSVQAVPATFFRYRRRPLLPSTANEKSELQTGAMAYTIATDQRLLQIGGLQTGAMEYAIATGRTITQLGGRSSRSHDSISRPHRFIHGTALQIGGL